MIWWIAGYLVGGTVLALLIGRIVRTADEAEAETEAEADFRLWEEELGDPIDR